VDSIGVSPVGYPNRARTTIARTWPLTRQAGQRALRLQPCYNQSMELRTLVIGLSHIGIRVHDYDRSRAFYALLGFEHAWGPVGPDNVAAMRHPSGLELNFIVNAPDPNATNILMDVADKHPGITHLALQVSDVGAIENALKAAGVAISGHRGENPVRAVFVRDPDRNVIELAND
jgi:lactoylglutathione lyase